MQNKDEIEDYGKRAQRLDAMHAAFEYSVNHIIKTLKEKGFCVSRTDFAIVELDSYNFNGTIVFQPQGEEIASLEYDKWGHARGTDYNDFLEAIKKYIKEKENDEIDR